MKGTEHHRVAFVEDDETVLMDVECDGEDFNSEVNEESDDETEVILNMSAHSENNNALAEEARSDTGENSSDEDYEKVVEVPCKFRQERPELSLTNGSNKKFQEEIIGQAIDQAMAQVKEMLNQSGIIETASILKQQIEDSKSSNENPQDKNK